MENAPITVAGMVTLLANETGGDEVSFGRIARTMINVGLLPKASGRAVPTVSLDQRARFLLACMATDRASEAPVAMMERWAATDPYNDEKSAGDFLLDHMALLAAGDTQAWQLWNYSRLDVSRSIPSVTARFNESLSRFDDATTRTDQFINHNAMEGRETRNGFEVTASCRGSVLIALACGLPFVDALRAFKAVERAK